ncbi:MAG TPA: LapA family protein [Acidimicrobiales bacterium]|nr:LapA family protein [Acidimicrobiales bacterium]
MADPDGKPTKDDKIEAKARRRQTVRLGVFAVVGVLFAVIALDNRQSVSIGWVVDEVKVPLVLALVVSLIIGIGIGFLLARRHHDT